MAWEIDPFHTLVEFSVKHLAICTVKGRFKDVSGQIHIDPQHPETSWIKAQVKTDSIDTAAPQRDAHLRSADFFEVVRYPTIHFESTQIEPRGQKHCLVTGALTLRGVTRSVPFQAEYTGVNRDPMTDGWRIGLYAATMIDRREFGMTFNQRLKSEVLLISNEVRIDIHLEALHA